MEYEILTILSTNYTYLYLFNDKQCFNKTTSTNNGDIYRCTNRNCLVRVQIKKNICEKINNYTHQVDDKGESEYTSLKILSKLEQEVLLNPNKKITEIVKDNNIPLQKTIQEKLYRFKNKLKANKENTNVPTASSNVSENDNLIHSTANPINNILSNNGPEFSSNFSINSLRTNHHNQANSPLIFTSTQTKSNLMETNAILKQTFDILNQDTI